MYIHLSKKKTEIFYVNFSLIKFQKTGAKCLW